MPSYLAPDVYIEEVPAGPRPIEAVGTSTAGFVGVPPVASAHVNEVVPINNWTEFRGRFVSEGSTSTLLSHAVYGFFLNGGSRCYVANPGANKPIAGGGRQRMGLELFEEIDEIAIVAAPGLTDPASLEALMAHCEKLKDRVAVLDTPEDVPSINLLTQVAVVNPPAKRGSAQEDKSASAPASPTGGLRPRPSEFAALYFPWITVQDPLPPNAIVSVAPSGHLAGIWARTDSTRGVHKAPANEPVRGAVGLAYTLTRAEQEELNPNGVNVIRFFRGEGIRVWGARTLAPSSSEFRYLNVRRLFAMVEESIARSMRWVVFEPNDMTLWKSIRRDVGAFLKRLWRDGALMGTTPEEAFFVKCDAETNPSEIVDAGMVVTIIGMAPVKPAEFVVFRISQHASGAEVEIV